MTLIMTSISTQPLNTPILQMMPGSVMLNVKIGVVPSLKMIAIQDLFNPTTFLNLLYLLVILPAEG